MATFIGTAANETITPASVSATVSRFPLGSFPGAGADVLLGRGGNDSLDGGGGNDVMDGGDGNDFLRGNLGADVLIGSAGTDTATYTESAAGINVSLATGLGFFGSAAGDTLFEIENLTGSNFADTLTGNALANTLNGFGGNDFLRGNTGADFLIGGAGIDTATYTESAAGVNVSLATGLGFFGSAAGDTLNGIENLNGSNFADTLTGNALANTLNGFGGNDLLRGNLGADVLIGGAGIDTATYTESATGINVNLTTGVGFFGSAAGDTLNGIENLIGSNSGDTLTGNALANTLNGFGGNDLLRGNLGADVLIGGAGIDTATYSESAAGINVNLTTGLGFFGSAAGDTLNGIENLTGSNSADTLTGNALANTLNGFGGNDLLRGNLGADVLIGGAGIDTATYSESAAGINVNLTTGLGFFGSAAGDTLNGIENLTGSNSADTLTGNALANTLNGFGGNDVLTGGLGRDVMIGSAGFDRFDFNSSAESVPGLFTRDVVADFDGNGIFAGDVVDVSTMDANNLLLGNQAFAFIGGAAFSAAGQLRYSGGVLQANTDADAFSELEVGLTGAPALTVFDIAL